MNDRIASKKRYLGELKQYASKGTAEGLKKKFAPAPAPVDSPPRAELAPEMAGEMPPEALAAPPPEGGIDPMDREALEAALAALDATEMTEAPPAALPEE